jgi:tetratricopeptide (TPR) repeat protein
VILPIAAIVAWVAFRPTGSPFRAPDSRIPQSFAVLPMRSTTGTDAELVESLTESLIAEMLHVSWPNWRSRPPVLRATPGKKAEAEALFAGSLYRTGNRIRVSGSLEHLASGVILWNGSLERNLGEWTDRATLLENVAATLGEAMNVALMERFEQELSAVYPARVKSRHDWLAADELWRRPDAESVRAALPLLENACRLDPNFAWAHASLAHAYVRAVGLGIVPDEPYRKRAHQEVAKALEIGPYLAFAHASAARVALNLDWDFQGANASCIASIGMLAAAGTVRNQCAAVQSLAERYDIADAISNSTLRRLPDNVSALTELAATHYRRRRFDEAIAYAKRALRSRPQAVAAREVLVLADLQRKAFDTARQAAQEGESIAGEAGRFAALHAIAVAAAGNREAALKKTAHAEGLFVDPMPNAPLIRMYLALGNPDRARKLLDEALRRRDVGLLEMRLNPMIKDLDSQGLFEQVRSKARF